MKVWFISDCHFGHANIIKYCSRPFASVDEMDAVIIDNINKVVAPEDILYNLGDFCMGKERIKYYAKQIVCQKHFLILGNHDYKYPRLYMESGFAWASRLPVIYDDHVILSHQMRNLKPDKMGPFVNLFGHEHDKTPLLVSPRQFNISCDHTGYAPIAYDKIKQIIAGKIEV